MIPVSIRGQPISVSLDVPGSRRIRRTFGVYPNLLVPPPGKYWQIISISVVGTTSATYQQNNILLSISQDADIPVTIVEATTLGTIPRSKGYIVSFTPGAQPSQVISEGGTWTEVVDIPVTMIYEDWVLSVSLLGDSGTLVANLFALEFDV